MSLGLCLAAGAQTGPAPNTGAPALVPQRGHSDVVVWAAVSPDGSLAATSAADNSVRLWELAEGRELRVFLTEGPAPVLFSPDGSLLLVSDGDLTVALRDVETGAIARRLAGGHTRRLIAADFAASGGTLVTAQSDRDPQHNFALVWDVASGQIVRHLPASSLVRSVAMSPDGTRVAVATRSDGVRIWESDDPGWDAAHELAAIALPDAYEVVFASNTRLLTSTVHGKADAWDADTGELLGRRSLGFSAVEDPPGSGVNLSASSDGQRLLALEPEGVAVVDVESGDRVRVLRSASRVTAIALSHDGRTVLGGAANGAGYVWHLDAAPEPDDLRPDLTLERAAMWVQAAALSESGLLLGLRPPLGTAASASPGLIWDESGQPLPLSTGDWSAVEAIALDPEGELVALGSDAATAEVILIDASSGDELHRLAAGRRRAEPVGSLAFSHDGEIVMAGGDGFNVPPRAWDALSGERVDLAVAAVLDEFDYIDYTLVASARAAPVLMIAGLDVRAWDQDTGDLLLEYEQSEEGDAFTSLALSADGHWAAAGLARGQIMVWDLRSDEPTPRQLSGHADSVQALTFSPGGDYLASGSDDSTARLWDIARGRHLLSLEGHSGWLTEVLLLGYDPDLDRVDPDMREDLPEHWDRLMMITAADDGTTRFWRLRDGKELLQLVSFTDDTWAVVDSLGRYDAARAGEISGLHWVVGREAIELAQLKERYWEPGLFAKQLLGTGDEPLRDVARFADVAMYPDVQVDAVGDDRVRITLTNRGGGIGPVQVKVAGKELTADAREPGVDPMADRLTIDVDLGGSALLAAGIENLVEVTAANAAGYLRSRGSAAVIRARGDRALPEPTLWIIAAGVSDYSGDALDLRFAELDALDFARALEIGGRTLFDDRVEVLLLSTQSTAGTLAPSRANLEAALVEARAARPEDVVVVYLAGHGVTHGGAEGDYYFLTQEARSGDLDDPAVRATSAISSLELTELINAIPARKQLLILDTCASGRVVERLVDRRDVPSSQKRALERMKDRAGLFVLAGSAADAVSYETSRYGQGLLTYSLLQGIRGEALREEQFVDVAMLLNHAADRVPDLARGIGGIQRPEVRMPRLGSFDIGQLDGAARAEIHLEEPRPVIVRTSFQAADSPADPLRLTAAVHRQLRNDAASADAGFVFVDAADYPGSFSLGGRYETRDGHVAVEVVLFLAGEEIGRYELEGATAEVDVLAARLATLVAAELF
jgi:WD40 repeat protein